MNTPTNHTLPVGTLLYNCRYRIDAFLASGGFGNTYRATDLTFNETVAIKEFFMRETNERHEGSREISVSNPDSKARFEEQKRKFVKEAQRIRRLDNHHIIRVLDLFEENGTAYYVMDFIPGCTLSEEVKRHGTIDELTLREYMAHILDALDVVHSQGIYHLDIKPSNIMLDTERCRAVLIDFGASKQVDPEGGITMSTILCFTPGYAPQEQVEQAAEKFGPWTDLYSLGATLYYALTAQRPPLPSDISEKGAAAFLLGNNVSPQMQSFISSLMNPMRTKRPQSVAEARQLLSMPHHSHTSAPQQPSTPIDPDMTRPVAHTPQPQSQPEQTQVMGGDGGAARQQPSPQTPSDAEEQPLPPMLTRRNYTPIYIATAIGAVALVFILVMLLGGRQNVGGSQSDDTTVAQSADTTWVTEQVIAFSNHKWVLEEHVAETDGVTQTAVYTGPVDNTGRPHGKGTAAFLNNGMPNGNVYEGPWQYGVRSGDNARYTYHEDDNRNNWYVFEGKYAHDAFLKGKLTFNDGSTFEGTFKDNQPSDGTWRDAKGKPVK